MDQTRVVLKWPPNAPSDYIHANYVGLNREFNFVNCCVIQKCLDEKKFICTQGPILSTVNDFWRMVWQEKCKIIIMLCELVEQGKFKCEQYYPLVPGTSMNFDYNLSLRNVSVVPVEDVMTTTRLLVCAFRINNKTRISRVVAVKMRR